MPDGRYVVQLPFSVNPPVFGASVNTAVRSFEAQERRLLRKPTEYRLYRESMTDYLLQNHMEPVSSASPAEGSFYLPHHGVKKETSTTTKLRVVFNASNKSSNCKSLNDNLLIGAKLQADIPAVLLPWRFPRFVFCADIADKAPEADTEARPVQIYVADLESNDTLTELSSRFSSWKRLLRVTAYLLKWRCTSDTALSGSLSADDVRRASLVWLRWLQSLSFPNEIVNLREGTLVSRQSRLKGLNPYLDEDGLIRVGGRLNHAALSSDAKHPVILGNHELVRLIIQQSHYRCLHGGVSLTLQTLRDQFWILQAKKRIRSVIFHCITCTRLKAALAKQLMGDMPAPRVLTPKRPFQHCGVDYAGPVQLRTSKGRGHKSTTGYIAVFVCFAVKAVHLEIVSDYTSAAFIAAFQRFVGRRDIPSDMYSDCGTTFIGADKELRKSFNAAIRDPEFRSLLADDGTTWHFLPLAAPHFGGLWVAGVKSVKYHLKRVLQNRTPTFEELRTLLCEIESCLNSRPLAAMTDNIDDWDVLTPGYFLTGTRMRAVPRPSLLDLSLNSLPRWQLYRQMRDKFWAAWSGDYIRSLQHRAKWRQLQENFAVGQLVLVHVKGVPPTKWPLARVIACSPGNDGQVRVVTLRTATTEFQRPVAKLVPLPVQALLPEQGA